MPGYRMFHLDRLACKELRAAAVLQVPTGLKGLFVQPNMDKNKIIERSRDHGRRHMPFFVRPRMCPF